MDENYNRLRDDEREHIDSIFTGKRHGHMMARDALSHGLVGTAGGAVAGNIVGRAKRSKAGRKAVEAASSGFKNKVLNAINKNRLKDIEAAARKGVSLTKYTLGGAAIGATGGAAAGAIRGHHRFKKLKEGFTKSALDRQQSYDELQETKKLAEEMKQKQHQSIDEIHESFYNPLRRRLKEEYGKEHPDKAVIDNLKSRINDLKRQEFNARVTADRRYSDRITDAQRHYDTRQLNRVHEIERLKKKYKF